MQRLWWGQCFSPGAKRHMNTNFMLWFKSRWPWDKRLVVPGLTGPKSLCVCLETQEILIFPLVNRRVVPALSRLSKSLCVQSLCAFFLPYYRPNEKISRRTNFGGRMVRMRASMTVSKCSLPQRASTSLSFQKGVRSFGLAHLSVPL